MSKYRWIESKADGYALCKRRHSGIDYLLYICHLPGLGRDCFWFVRADGREVARGTCEDIGAAAARAEHYYERWIAQEWRVYG